MRLTQRFYSNKNIFMHFSLVDIRFMYFLLDLTSLSNLFVSPRQLEIGAHRKSVRSSMSEWNLRGRTPNLTDFIQIYTAEYDSFAIYNNYYDDCC